MALAGASGGLGMTVVSILVFDRSPGFLLPLVYFACYGVRR